MMIAYMGSMVLTGKISVLLFVRCFYVAVHKDIKHFPFCTLYKDINLYPNTLSYQFAMG